MALTLVEAAKLAGERGETQRAAVIQTYASSVDILRVLPMENIPGGALKYNQEQALPGIGFRGVNEAYSESTGVVNPVVDPLVISGGDLDVDNFILETQGMEQRTVQENMKVKALAHRWAHAFIKGDSLGNTKEYDGLQTRLTGDQLIDAGSTSGGDALSLTKLDELIDAVDEAGYLLMSKAMRRRLTAAARDQNVGGYINYSLDQFGRRVTQYNDLPILIADPNGAVFKTLGFNEANPGGGSNVGTSIYCLSFGDGVMTGIQSSDPQVRDLGELQTKPVMRSRVEWYSGIAVYHPRAAARLRGIKDAAVVA